MKIYISIPISGHDINEQKAKAYAIAGEIRALGHEPVNPFDTPTPQGDLSETERYAYFMGEDLKRLLLCDAVYFVAGWTDSRGCMIENAAAYCSGIDSYYYLSNIPSSGNSKS